MYISRETLIFIISTENAINPLNRGISFGKTISQKETKEVGACGNLDAHEAPEPR